jgi:hypothetical protein
MNRLEMVGQAQSPPGEEGCPRHQEKWCEASFDGAGGVVDCERPPRLHLRRSHPSLGRRGLHSACPNLDQFIETFGKKWKI